MAVVFSVSGHGHVSEGDADLVNYDRVHCNVGDGWKAPCTFEVPAAGAYLFSISFVRDSHYHEGTQDDVRLELRVDGSTVASAWAGEGAGMRATGTLTIALELAKGAKIETYASSDDSGRNRRHLMQYQLTGHLVAEQGG